MGKKDQFDNFLEKQFGAKPVKIAQPLGGERATSIEDRRRAVEEERSREEEERAKGAAVAAAVSEAPAGEGSAGEEPAVPEKAGRKVGRPVVNHKEMVPMNMNIEKELKTKLEILRIELYRSSVTDLVKEAIRDLLIKYGREV